VWGYPHRRRFTLSHQHKRQEAEHLTILSGFTRSLTVPVQCPLLPNLSVEKCQIFHCPKRALSSSSGNIIHKSEETGTSEQLLATGKGVRASAVKVAAHQVIFVYLHHGWLFNLAAFLSSETAGMKHTA